MGFVQDYWQSLQGDSPSCSSLFISSPGSLQSFQTTGSWPMWCPYKRRTLRRFWGNYRHFSLSLLHFLQLPERWALISSPKQLVTGQEAMASSCAREGSDWTSQKKKFRKLCPPVRKIKFMNEKWDGELSSGSFWYKIHVWKVRWKTFIRYFFVESPLNAVWFCWSLSAPV